MLCAIVLAANVILWAMAHTPDFPYATVRFSLSNLISMMGLLFLMAGLLVWVLFGDDRANGTFKNALANGLSRRGLFVGKCLVSVVLGLTSMAVVLAVYIGSAMLLLEGPAAESVGYLLRGVASALPFTVACVVLAVAVFAVLPRTIHAFFAWFAVVVLVPQVFLLIGQAVQPVAALASWLPWNFFANEVFINQAGLAAFLWDTPAGLAKCLIAGFIGIAAFAAVGLWRADKVEL